MGGSDQESGPESYLTTTDNENILPPYLPC
jgi:hypothetical protein